ncbi:MAG: VWD domain-containing protein [Reyranella sp.]|uniref:VWD domain-containing protein n=1 Tax=Reyranella sp. TaxID=1929291 RepID=UPI001AD1C9D0|nr:VWD domain-containing protein [Reyranella sp.]MBN9086118.1 VWD domain-containing protein [Reyranella sp.]
MMRIISAKWWRYLLGLLIAAGLAGYVLDRGVGGPPPAPVVAGPPGPVPVAGGGNAKIPTEITDEDDGHAHGDVHVRTVDGAFYDLQLIGEFVALKSERDDFQIQLRMGPWGGSSKTISTNIAVALNVAGDRVAVYVRQPSALRVNGRPVASLEQPMHLPNGGTVGLSGQRITVTWPDDSVARIDLRGDYLDLSVIPDRARAGTLRGLFGNFDGNAANDLVARGGSSEGLPRDGEEASTRNFYRRFGDSWRVSQAESLFDYGPGETTATWTDLKFPYQIVSVASFDGTARQKAEEACKAAGVSDPRLLRNCVLDLAATGHQPFIQSALQAQQDSLLQEGFGCRGLRSGGSRCTYYRPSLEDARAGEKFHITVETMQSDAKRVEEFDCDPVDAQQRAACKFKTRGRVFEGSNTVERYVASNGQMQELKGTMQKR